MQFLELLSISLARFSFSAMVCYFYSTQVNSALVKRLSCPQWCVPKGAAACDVGVAHLTLPNTTIPRAGAGRAAHIRWLQKTGKKKKKNWQKKVSNYCNRLKSCSPFDLHNLHVVCVCVCVGQVDCFCQ